MLSPQTDVNDALQSRVWKSVRRQHNELSMKEFLCVKTESTASFGRYKYRE
jgi:hypothetical protein